MESQAMLDASQKEARALSAELLKLRHACLRGEHHEPGEPPEREQQSPRYSEQGLEPEWEQGALAEPWPRGHDCPPGHTLQHWCSLTQVLTLPFFHT